MTDGGATLSEGVATGSQQCCGPQGLPERFENSQGAQSTEHSKTLEVQTGQADSVIFTEVERKLQNYKRE